MSRFVNPVPQYFLDDGTVASSGRMKFFVNKDYSTLKDTYSQPDNTIENINPLPLDGEGRMPPCFGDGLYSVKFYAYDPNQPDYLGSLQWTRDDVSLSSLTGQFSDWNPVIPYDIGDIVKASNGDYYQSFKTPNAGNNPTLSPAFWSKVVFITEYNENVTYADDEIVSYQGKLYASNTNGNIGHTPPASQWDSLTFNNSITGNFTVSGIITAAEYAGGKNRIAKKTSSTTRASTVTLAADPDLSVTGLDLSSWYKVSVYVLWDGNGSTANGILARVGATSGSLSSATYTCTKNTSAANAAPESNVNSNIPSGFSKLPSLAGASEVLLIEAVVSTSGSGSPTIYFEWAQASSNATSTRVSQSSHMIVTKL